MIAGNDNGADARAPIEDLTLVVFRAGSGTMDATLMDLKAPSGRRFRLLAATPHPLADGPDAPKSPPRRSGPKVVS